MFGFQNKVTVSFQFYPLRLYQLIEKKGGKEESMIQENNYKIITVGKPSFESLPPDEARVLYLSLLDIILEIDSNQKGKENN